VQCWIASAALAGPSFPLNAAILDSGATHHMSDRREIFSELCPIPSEDVEGILGKASALEVGTIGLQLADGTRVQLQDALYVPGMVAPLATSARLFTTNGYTTVFGARGSTLDCQQRYNWDGEIVMCTPPPA
jgi:hypothetical protein